MARMSAIAFSLIGAVLLNILGHCEMYIYPGLRRKPSQQTVQQSYDVPADYLVQLMEENARRRLRSQFEQQLELINMQMRQRQALREQRYREQQLQALTDNEDEYPNNNNNNNNNENSNADFSYNPEPNIGDKKPSSNGMRIPFAVGPSDPRFFYDEQAEDDNRDDEELSQVLDDYEEYVPAETKQVASVAADKAEAAGSSDITTNAKDVRPMAPAPVEAAKLDSAGGTTFHRIKPQSAAADAVASSMKEAQNGGAHARHDINALIDKLQKEGKSGAIINGHDDEHMVVRQHLGLDSEVGVYVVALIAGVSAAVTVGLIALGIAWYTFHNKNKAAADVEYPAYGVTGPNKDISPSGDRKLAQSAQMYHYQHQKQQIIAMENRQAVEGSCGLSDVESDDDNEEGDYTVYECPGLAPTGEMEVKNPLFLDETPVTPLNNTAVNANVITQAMPQQPVAPRKVSAKATVAAIAAATSLASTSSDDKQKKNNSKK